MKPDTAEKLLVWILRTAGAVCALAIVPMLMPTAWAQAAHAAIGLGELPGIVRRLEPERKVRCVVGEIVERKGKRHARYGVRVLTDGGDAG